MKTGFLSVFYLVSLSLFAQDFNKNFNAIQKTEAKAALSKMLFKANINTGNYDVKYHRLKFNVDPSTPFISGDVTTYFEAKENLTQVTFDLSNNMTVSKVLQRGNALSFSQNANDELIITLPATQNTSVLDSLTISYSGDAESSGLGSFEQNEHNGSPVIWTLSEPYGAKGWWPCKQDLIDKADSIDVYITSPTLNPSNEVYVAVSNGLEKSQTINGSNKITHFKHRYPIPAYLIAIAVTNYEVYSHTVQNNNNPFDIINYVYPENISYAQSNTPVTVEIMDLYTNLFEEYPFANEKYGHAQFGWGGGMEHTTVSFMGSFSRGLIAHELAHQWFGNKITCGSWKDIWLNEGFATYLSGLTIENLDGNSDFIAWKEQLNANITSSTNGAVYLTDADTTSVNRVFSSRLSYDKGAMVLHMLRKKLGDVNFFQGVKSYLSNPNHAYGYAKTPDFINIMESSSGENLTEFFNDWLYNEGYPSYTVQWSQTSANQTAINLSQTQSDASVTFFEAPVTLKLIGTLGETLDITLNNTVNNEDFSQTVNFTVASVQFDPESDLISKNNNVTLADKNLELQSQFKIYPVPTSNQFNIVKPEHIQVTDVKIFNTLGQLIYHSNWSQTINATTFSSGLLLVQFITNQGVINKTLLKN
ncbi:putative secreted protein (Por secretion system target) [Mariniflexile fucanivorans]|uniref:Aminopeptidase N n=1 Tax=Mariniflexile fucanivorans TaxID=264023 RepID=A0A4R1RRR5_9FLAO|nr:M1 family aminopeptidase [Mariniflexile fucanivorans]TCL69135.1 putative secreted protein (Por secretion system target) [Mariniflexile fucanivorans]